MMFQHLFFKLSPLFVCSLSTIKLINQSFKLWDMPTFKMNMYHKLKISYVIRLVIIKHDQVREFNDTLNAIWWYKTLMKMHFWVLITYQHRYFSMSSFCRTCIITTYGSRNFLFLHLLHEYWIPPSLIFLGLDST